MGYTQPAGIGKIWLRKWHAGTKDSLLLLADPSDRQRQTNRQGSQKGWKREIVGWCRQTEART